MNDLFNIWVQQAIDEALIIQSNLHFIRADWFYAFIPLFLFLYFSYKTRLNNKNWLGVIDQQLLPFVLSSTANKRRRYPLLLVFIACSLCITALAGPVYKKLPQPVYREQSSLVVLLDLSQSMNATDIKPSRLSRAKLELLDLLKTRKAGQTALIVYAADAFVVTPLTDDNATIANLAPSLETNMMPAQGSNLSKALVKTSSLFSQAGIINGNILVITDDIHKRDEVAIKKIVAQGHRLSVFGTGSAEGAPVPLDGGFLQNSEGAIVIPKLYPAKLQNYALLGGGLYSSLQADDSDIDKFTSLFQSTEVSRDIDSKNLNADVWQEEGHWLLLPVLFFAALWARKGWLAVLLIFILPLPQQAQAEQTHSDYLTNRIIDSKHLWSSPDQKAMKLFNSGDNEKAAENFTQAEWKASALYRNGDFEASAKTLENTTSGNGYYNKGNALARLGKFEEAIKAYDKALELNESNDDASYNREQVKQALEKQQQDEQKQEGEKQQQDDQQDSEQQDEQQQDEQQESQPSDSDKQSSEQSKNESKDESEKDQQQQPSPTSDSKEQQQMEQEQLEQRDAEAEAEKQKQEEQQYQQDQEENQQQEDQQPDPDNTNKEVEHKDSEEKPIDVEVNPMEASITEDEKATEQWLKRIPDDPGGLLRRKFYYQYKNIPNQSDDNEPW